MAKTAVQINLVWVDDESQTMRIHAVLSDGKLDSDEMYCHLFEWNGEKNEMQPGLLVDEDGDHRRYIGEWGYGDESNVTFEFLDRPLEIGQQVSRTDCSSGSTDVYIYRITDLVDLLA
ncbi:TPA: hypothetical protein ACRNNE_000680 [Pseudomonas aeruginosa]|nr:hypothetical protein IPC1518_04310 [Pseudomonas aeruginosa]HDQ4569187.1 hypothetical protein [Pseudomonas aeruginosa]